MDKDEEETKKEETVKPETKDKGLKTEDSSMSYKNKIAREVCHDGCDCYL